MNISLKPIVESTSGKIEKFNDEQDYKDQAAKSQLERHQPSVIKEEEEENNEMDDSVMKRKPSSRQIESRTKEQIRIVEAASRNNTAPKYE